MRVFCCKCHKLVGEIAPGSKIRRGTVYVCAECQRPKDDCEVVDFITKILKGEKK